MGCISVFVVNLLSATCFYVLLGIASLPLLYLLSLS